MLKVSGQSRFAYPAADLELVCAVRVYREDTRLLVALEDSGELEPVMETLAWEVSRRVLEPRGLAGLTINWVHLNRARGRIYEVAFADVELFIFPLRREVSGWELEGWAEDFGLEPRSLAE